MRIEMRIEEIKKLYSTIPDDWKDYGEVYAEDLYKAGENLLNIVEELVDNLADREADRIKLRETVINAIGADPRCNCPLCKLIKAVDEHERSMNQSRKSGCPPIFADEELYKVRDGITD